MTAPTFQARRNAILAFLDGRGWTQWGAIQTHLGTAKLLAGKRTSCDIAADLRALIKAGLIEREAVPGMVRSNGEPVYSYRRVRA